MTTSSPGANRGAPGIHTVVPSGSRPPRSRTVRIVLGAAGEVLDHRDACARANDARGRALDDAVEDTAAHDAVGDRDQLGVGAIWHRRGRRRNGGHEQGRDSEKDPAHAGNPSKVAAVSRKA